MEVRPFEPESKFKTPEEEREYLRAQLARVEKELSTENANEKRDEVISQHIEAYKDTPVEKVLHPDLAISQSEIHKIAENLAPETHDRKIEELLVLLKDKGIKNVLSLIEKMGDSHVEDDLHRFLVQYVKKGFSVTGLPERAPLSKALKMTLYEVVLPDNPEEEKSGLKEMLSGMEQFYAGMLSVSSSGNPSENYIVLEIANSQDSDEFIFYVSVPDSKKDLFEKQILSVFHDARISEAVNDHNIFNEKGESVGSVARAAGNPIFPIKTYEQFDHDPLNVILNSFSKINREGEGACLQVIMAPAGDYYHKKYKDALQSIEKGTSVKEAIDIPMSTGGEVVKTIKDLFASAKEKKKDEMPKPPDTAVVERINKKIEKPIVSVGLRLLASAGSRERALNILSDLESSFNQFTDTQGGGFKFGRLKGGNLKKMIRHFAFRSYSSDEVIPLNLSELTTFMHFHTTALKGVSQLKTVKAGDAPPPLELPTEGTLLGVNLYRNKETKVFITDEDRLRHIYTIGQTGTGKSTLLINMIIQDIKRGNGCCMIDPHGTDIQKVLANVPKERMKDVIYFDPSYTPRPMGLNMLEYDRSRPEQKTFVVNELFSIFQKLYGAVPESMGPMFEQYFRNATMLVIEDPDTSSTLLDVSRVMADREYRQLKLSRCKNPVVVQFWREVAEKAGGEASLANIVPYITSKFDVFLANDIMRPIVAQEKSAFNFRDIMDNKKILLVNLSKGRLGDINANLIGLILVGKILMAALSRVDLVGTASEFHPFYLYIDEFQNITTPSVASILSEARKYKLSLFIAHQFIGQLEDNIKSAVFGNVGTIVCYRIGADDAEYIVKQFEPVFTAQQIINVDNFNAYIKMLSHGKPLKPFNVRCMPQPAMPVEHLDAMKEYSYLKYGRNRNEIEAEINKKYEKTPAPEHIQPQI